jgi:MFS transporter, DHA1 family, tetracycline resistance protein
MIVMLLVVFVDLLGFGVIIPLLPFYGEHFGASPVAVTSLLSTYSGLQLIFAPIWGRLSDRFGRRPVVLISLATSVAAYLWMGVADALWMLFAARALQGISAGNISVAQAYIADITTPENRAKGMGGLGAAIGLGFTLGPLGGLLAGPDNAHINVGLPSLLAAALSAIALVIASLRLKESLTPAIRARAKKAVGRIALLRDAFGRPRLRILMILFFTTTFAFAGMESTFGIWADEVLHWATWQVGIIFVVIGLVLVLVQAGLIRVVIKRYGEAQTLFAGTIGIGVGLALLAAATEPVLGVIATCCLALGMGLASPSSSALISKEAAAEEQGSILGVNQSVGSFARLVGPAVAGQAFEYAGPSAPYMVGTLVMLISAAIAYHVARQRRLAAVASEAEAA